jgi:hypothetical protein
MSLQGLGRLVHGKSLGDAAQVDAQGAPESNALLRQEFDVAPVGVAGGAREPRLAREIADARERGCDRDIEQPVAGPRKIAGGGEHVPSPGMNRHRAQGRVAVQARDVRRGVVITHQPMYLFHRAKGLGHGDLRAHAASGNFHQRPKQRTGAADVGQPAHFSTAS